MNDTESSDSSISSSFSMAAVASSIREKPKPFSQSQLNDLARDIGLSKKSPEVLASRIGEYGILDSGTKITFYSDDLLIHFFTMEDDFVYWNNIQDLFSEMGLPEYNLDEWRWFINSSKRNLKCVLLHSCNEFACVPIKHYVIVKEHYLNVSMVLQKLRYNEHS